MTYKELKERLDSFTEQQLSQQVAVFTDEDQEIAHILDSVEISEEDVYWEHHGDCLGTLEVAKETIGENWEQELEEAVIVPKGTVTLHTT